MANARNHDMTWVPKVFVEFLPVWLQGEAHRKDLNCLKVKRSILMTLKDEESVSGLPPRSYNPILELHPIASKTFCKIYSICSC